MSAAEEWRLTDEQRDSLLAWVSFDTDEGEAGFLEEVESLIAAGQVAALEDAADEQERLSTGPRAMGSKAVQFKRIIFAEWLRARAAELRETP